MSEAAAICAIGFASGVLCTLFIKRATNSGRIRLALNSILASLFEFRLFADQPVVILKAQGRLIVANARLLQLLIVPSLVMVLPYWGMLAATEGMFGHRPLKPGESTVVTVQCRHPSEACSNIQLQASPGLFVETPSVRIDSLAQVSWRVRALRPVSGQLQILAEGRRLGKTISSDAGLRVLSEERGGTLWSFADHPLETPLFDPLVESIRFTYPPRFIFHGGWLIWFGIASACGALVPIFMRPNRVVAFLLMIVLAGCHPLRRGSSVPDVIVLGVDGMDPEFVSRHWNDLPNLRQFRDRGSFRRLATTTPPQSPVAWSTLITGLDPGQHGIFDFIHRDAATLQPFSSLSKTEGARYQLALGPFLFPLSKSRIISLRKGTPFWQTLSERGVPVTVVRMPTNYPPIRAGRAISGMGTPDLDGTLGTFTFYTDDRNESSHSVSGGTIVTIQLNHGHAALELPGPANSLRKDHAPAIATLLLDVDPDHPVARLQSGSDLQVLKEGEWSSWMVASFPLIPHLSSVHGTFRVFAKELHPGIRLYVSPINIDPMMPALPVSSPADWSRNVAQETGRFYTVGIPEDTSALRQDIWSLSEFKQQAQLVLDDERNLLDYSLRHYAGGFLFFYFSSIDQNSHILWGSHELDLLEVYKAIDECIGEVMRRQPQAELIVMSDHGFTSFNRAVNLNSWLSHHGFLSLAGRPGDETSLNSVNWAGTQAYAIGLNGLYLNLRSRELHGIIAPGRQSSALAANLRNQLTAWRDPANGKQVVEAVYETRADAANAAVAPDLIVGYAPGYRASWQTALGGTPQNDIQDNTDDWIGDHCINPVDVPGVLFTNRRNSVGTGVGIEDVTAMILKLYGLPPKPLHQ